MTVQIERVTNLSIDRPHYAARSGYAVRPSPEPRFVTVDGRVIGGLRHSGLPGSWHYHSTDGVEHCTRMVSADEVERIDG